MVVVQADWLRLCLLTETNQSHEMPFVAWAIRNRVDREDRFPNNYFGVITQPMQFSWFNDKHPFADTSECLHDLGDKVMMKSTKELWDDAWEVANLVITSPRWEAPFGPKVDHYYSPESMRPRGHIPVWAREGFCYRSFTLSGVDPERFVFVQERS